MFNESNRTASDARAIREQLRTAILTCRKYEEDKAFAEYAEGIMEACRKALTILCGDD